MLYRTGCHVVLRAYVHVHPCSVKLVAGLVRPINGGCGLVRGRWGVLKTRLEKSKVSTKVVSKYTCLP